MTEKLFYEHPVITSCEAQVLSCEEKNGSFEVVLDRTVIFPEGGGQPADRGTIGDIPVLDAHEHGGEVYHVCPAPVPVGARVTVALDTERRLDHSARHTGEHMLSGLAYKLFGAHNVGFHMAEDYATIDLDVFLDNEALSRLEEEANRAVRRDLPVTEVHTDHEGLASYTIRKKADIVSDDIRIVFIGAGEIDSCTCCGTHCASTGEVGYIRIADAQKYKSGVRIWFSCGAMAVREAAAITRSMTNIARSFSTSREELPAAIRKAQDELGQTKRLLKERTKALCGLIAAGSADEAAVLLRPELSAADVKLLAESLVSANARVALVFGGSEGGACYCAMRREGETMQMNELIKSVNALTGGKGGGSPAFAQGRTDKPVTEELAAIMRDYIKKAM